MWLEPTESGGRESDDGYVIFDTRFGFIPSALGLVSRDMRSLVPSGMATHLGC
jgi:hypothetical protein